MPEQLFIHAVNVHQGGGAVLLTDVLRAAVQHYEVTALVDQRFAVPPELESRCKIHRVQPSLLSRFRAERALARLVQRGDKALCFGNLPPLFASQGNVSVFLQNRYLIDPRISTYGLPKRARLRILAEKLWLRVRQKNAARFWVQTPTMQVLAEQVLKVPVQVCGFVPSTLVRTPQPPRAEEPKPAYDYVYVASGESHKGHKALLSAWVKLADQGQFPSLAVTLCPKREPDLVAIYQNAIGQHNLKIDILGRLEHSEVMKLYGNARALLYPSQYESFGLPLLEANAAGLPILASERDYVRDVVCPVETFDPCSSTSIARAVQRFQNHTAPVLEVCDGEGFLRGLQERQS